jgi:hypothetical protein
MEFLMQELILRGMVAKPRLALAILGLHLHRHQVTEKAGQEELAWKVHWTASFLLKRELRSITARCPQPSSGELKATQPSAVVLATGLEAVGALLRAEGGSAGVASNQAELSVTDRATLDFAVPRVLCVVAHFRPPKTFASSFSFASRSCRVK